MWELDYKESWAPKSWCFWTVVLEKTLESSLDCKEIQPVHPKGDQCSLEGLMLKLKLQHFGHLMRRADSLEKPWCWERWRAGGEGDNRGWDGWMASLTLWTWVWVDSGSWWRTGRPGMLRFMGSQKVKHDWATELNWTVIVIIIMNSIERRKNEWGFSSLILREAVYIQYVCGQESGWASQICSVFTNILIFILYWNICNMRAL